MLPTFLGIGSQRCGTSWLYHTLSKHPQVRVSREKELEYFGRWILKRDLRWYEAQFDVDEGEGDKPIRGEVSPQYSRLAEAVVRRIQRLLPDVRVVLLIREPVERAWKQALLEMGVLRGRDMGRVSMARLLRHAERARTTLYSDYTRILRTWRGAFGAEAVYVGLYDDLKADPTRLYHQILEHLGADVDLAPGVEVLSAKVNVTKDALKEKKEPPMPEELRWYLAKQYEASVVQLNELLGGRVSHWVEGIRAAAGSGRASWRLRRAVNKAAGSVPERVAYCVYNTIREARLCRRFDALLADQPRR